MKKFIRIVSKIDEQYVGEWLPFTAFNWNSMSATCYKENMECGFISKRIEIKEEEPK